MHCALYRKLLWAFRLWNRDPHNIDIPTRHIVLSTQTKVLKKLGTIVYCETGTVAYKMTQHHFLVWQTYTSLVSFHEYIQSSWDMWKLKFWLLKQKPSCGQFHVVGTVPKFPTSECSENATILGKGFRDARVRPSLTSLQYWSKNCPKLTEWGET